MEQLKIDGNEFFISEDFDSAITKYKEAILLVSETSDTYLRDSSTLHLNISATYCKLKNYDSALEHAAQSTKLQPEWYKSWHRLSVCLYKLGENDQALKAIQKTIECSNKEEVTCKYITDLKDSIESEITHANANDTTESEDSDEPDEPDETSEPVDTTKTDEPGMTMPNIDSILENPMMKDMLGNMQSNGTMPDMNNMTEQLMPMMESMMGNPKIKGMLDNKSFQEKILQNQSNPLAMLGDPDMKDIMAEMMKGMMNK